MAYYSDGDILVTSEEGDVLLTLSCGYGQPVASTVYVKTSEGATRLIHHFNGDIRDFKLGHSSVLKGQVVEIHSTIHDIRDSIPGKAIQDIKLNISIACNTESVDTEFIKRTKRTGQLVKCKYEVTVI